MVRVLACACLALSAIPAGAYTLHKGMVGKGGDLDELQGPHTIAQAKEKCDASSKCVAFTYDGDAAGVDTERRFVWFKTNDIVALPESGWITYTKSEQQFQVGEDGGVVISQGQECTADPPFSHGLTEPSDLPCLTNEEVFKALDRVYHLKNAPPEIGGGTVQLRWTKRIVGSDATMARFAKLLEQISPGLSQKIYESTLGMTVNFDVLRG
jgi:hypothetical protein